ncbi:MAG: DUF4928 family protein [Planctomycetota bacterium]
MVSRKTEDTALDTLADWFEYEHQRQEGDSDRYIVCAGLAVLEALRKNFPIAEPHYVTERNQVKTGGGLIKKILKRHRETRRYAAEGGRTTRATRPAAERLVERLNKLTVLKTLSEEERAALAERMQGWLVANGVIPYFNRQLIELDINLDKPGSHIISDILEVAGERNVAGAVAQHLVGAKLCLRYENKEIENYSYTTADRQLGRPGDFVVGDTAFHVTVAPMQGLIEKCAANIRNGYRVILVVAESKLAAARQMAEIATLQDRMGIFSIEQFVGQNIEEIGEFGRAALAQNIKALLEKYNERVAAAETDRSLLIQIPDNL